MGKHFAYTLRVRQEVIREYDIVVVARTLQEARILAATRDGFVTNNYGESEDFVFDILEKDRIDSDLQEIMDDLISGGTQ